jgi:hypothetical protein
MFPVKPKTVDYLFKAQRPQLVGKLRLDVASHCAPGNPRQPIDPQLAAVAIGERVIRVIGGVADDATIADPRITEVIVEPVRGHFESTVELGMQRAFGLDEHGSSSRIALDLLAEDLFDWVKSKTRDASALGLEQRYNKQRHSEEIVVHCVAFTPDFASLDASPGGLDVLRKTIEDLGKIAAPKPPSSLRSAKKTPREFEAS